MVPSGDAPNALGANGCHIDVQQTSIAFGRRDTELTLLCKGLLSARTVFEVRARGEASIRTHWIDANTLRVEYVAGGKVLHIERSLPLGDRTLRLDYVPVDEAPAPGCDFKQHDVRNIYVM